MQNLEGEISKQIKIFGKGESYLYIKQELRNCYDEITASKIAQEAYRRFRFQKTKKNIISGLIMFVIAQTAVFFINAENIKVNYIFQSILGIFMVVYGLRQIYNYRKQGVVN